MRLARRREERAAITRASKGLASRTVRPTTNQRCLLMWQDWYSWDFECRAVIAFPAELLQPIQPLSNNQTLSGRFSQAAPRSSMQLFSGCLPAQRLKIARLPAEEIRQAYSLIDVVTSRGLIVDSWAANRDHLRNHRWAAARVNMRRRPGPKRGQGERRFFLKLTRVRIWSVNQHPRKYGGTVPTVPESFHG
jgi:hypothetical protein